MMTVVVVLLVVVCHLFRLSEKKQTKNQIYSRGKRLYTDTCVTSSALQSNHRIDVIAPSDWLTRLPCLYFLLGFDCKELIRNFVLWAGKSCCSEPTSQKLEWADNVRNLYPSVTCPDRHKAFVRCLMAALKEHCGHIVVKQRVRNYIMVK